MATWQGVKEFIHSKYQAEDLGEGLVKLLFNTGDLRSQVVFVEFAGNDSGASWVKMSSPVGTVGEVDVRHAAEVLGPYLFGGLVVRDDWVYVTNGSPMHDLDPNEVTEPLERIVVIADELERELLGKDAV